MSNSDVSPPAPEAVQRIVKVRRDYNAWVARETLEDYALRFTPHSFRKWSELRVANTAFGAASFLVLEAVGATLLVDGRLAAAAFAGDGQDLARLAHRIHLDLWQIEEAVGRAGPGVAPANALEQHLAPVVEGLWAEYAAARRAAWTLPADADLMLPHLVELFEALPPATTGDASLALAGGDLEDLFRRSLGRVTHLMQVVGHVHGCLAGIGAPIENLSPALAGRVSQSFLGSRWGATGRVLAALFGSVGQWDAAFLQQTLRPEVEAAFTGLGLTLRPTDDGGLWLEPRAMPASPPGHA